MNEDKLVRECSVDELLEILKSRVPAMVAGLCVPDDNNTVDNVLMRHGSRAACLGLANGLHEAVQEDFLEGCVALGVSDQGVDDDDDDEDEDNGGQEDDDENAERPFA